MGSKATKFLWFLMGLGSQLQIMGSLSISEVLTLMLAPGYFLKECNEMKRDGVWQFFVLSLFVNVGCIIASAVNKTELAYALRGLAATVLMSTSIVVVHRLIRKDMMGFRWMIFGAFLSGFICLFVFKKQAEMVMLGESVEDIMGGPIFWISRLKPIVLLPISGWYLQTPLLYGIVVPILFAIFSLYISTSGRSAALALLAISCLVTIGRKRLRTMSLLSRHFYLFGMFAIVGLLIINMLYGYLARHEVFGAKFTEKYEHQTQEGRDIISLIVKGRAESFVGLWACVDKPIVGWGPWAMDVDGYYENFLRKYGSLEDYMYYLAVRRNNLLTSIREYPSIPAHSHITEFWLWFGLPGLVFILYSLFVILRYVKQDLIAVPQWYGWLLCGVPGMLWSICFSALSNRIVLPTFIVACLIARAVRKGRFRLPLEMEREIVKYAR